MDSTEENPSVLVVSCDDMEPSAIVKLMMEKEGLPASSKLLQGIEAYPWHINTKYYETDVTLYTLSKRELLPQPIAKGVQAVIVYFDSSKNDGLESAEHWQSFIRDYDADISILLCKRCSDVSNSGVSKLSAQEWCVQHGYELVELDPEVDIEWEEEQDFVETTGIKRVVQALHAHIWPNLVLKERREPTSMSALLHGGDLESEAPRLDTLPLDLGEGDISDRLEELLNGESDGDFYQLFGELQTMKERVSHLPSEQRKACAEQVVMAFWRAIGGDDEEVGAEQQPPPS